MPLRFPRTVAALLATGAAAASIGVAAGPAHADQVRHDQWWLESAGVTDAWPAAQGAGVTVAVLSDGIDISAPDVHGAVMVAPPPAGAPVAASPYAGEVGTPAASLIAGRGHGPGGKSGVIGIAPAARILSVAVTLPTDDPAVTAPSVAGGIPAAIAAGIRYAVGHGAQVIDLPIDPGEPDSTGMGGDSAVAGGSAAEQSAVSYALHHNVVLVAPAGDNAAGVDLAGNSLPDAPNYPAAYHGVIAVGATDSAGQLATWSSQQSYVALTAPGVGLTAASNAGSYQTVSSTSYASAIVAGVAALIRSRYPGLTASQVQQALTSSAVRPEGQQSKAGQGSGGVNAVGALTTAARLATPAAHPAGAGSRPRTASPGVAATQHGIAATIKRAGLLSGLLLAFLLLLIGFVALRRRRRRAGEAAGTGWTRRQGQSRYPQAAGTGTGRLAEVYAARQAAAAVSPVSAGPAPAGTGPAATGPAGTGPAGTGPAGTASAGARGQVEYLARAAQPDRTGQPARAAQPAVADRTFSGAAADRDWQPAYSPAPAGGGRRPSVSGAPPWEPAVAPTSELPWAAAAGRHSAAGRPAAPVRALPAGSQPDAAVDRGQRRGSPVSRRRLSPRGLPESTPGAQAQHAAGPDGAAGPRSAGSGPDGAAGPRSAGSGPRSRPPAADSWPHDPFRPPTAADPRPASPQPGAPGSPPPADSWPQDPYYSPTAADPRPASPQPGAPGSPRRALPAPPVSPRSAGTHPAHSRASLMPGPAHRRANQAAGPASPSGSADPADPPLHRAPTPPLRPATGPASSGPSVAPSGLPIRRPGATQPAPLSPSGSLWEPASSQARPRPDAPGSGSQAAGHQAEHPKHPKHPERPRRGLADWTDDTGSGPIYVWDPAAGQSARRGD